MCCLQLKSTLVRARGLLRCLEANSRNSAANKLLADEWENIGVAIELMRTAEANLSDTKAKSDVCPMLARACAATILWLIALRREKLDASFWDFFRIGIIVMPLALLAALAGSILLQFRFPAS